MSVPAPDLAECAGASPLARAAVAAPAARGWRRLACAAFLLHAALSLVNPDAGWTTSAGVIAVLLVALGVSLQRARRERGALASRWRLLAAAFVLWIAGFAAIAWHQVVQRADPSVALPYAFLLALRGVPWVLALMQTSATRAWRHKRWFDFAQGGLFALLLLLAMFPALLPGAAGAAPRAGGEIDAYRDLEHVLLAVLALAAIPIQPTLRERAFARVVAGLLVSYLVTALVVNHWVIDGFAPAPGSPVFLAVDLPLLVFTWMATAREGADGARVPTFASRVLQGLMPGLLTLGMLVVAFDIAARVAWAGMALGVLALALYALRSAVTHALYQGANRELSGHQQTLLDLAHRDPLTHLPNRRHFEQHMRQEAEAVLQAGEPVALLFVDVDAFKAYNDALGHLAGDACLRRVAAAMAAALQRSGDTIARYGGEEFVAVLRNIDHAGARTVAERLRQAVRTAAIAHPGAPAGIVTVSIGVAHDMRGSDTLQDLFANADAALYNAKATGRDRVVVA